MGDLPDVPEWIVKQARDEPSLRGRVFLCSKRRVALCADGSVVGFVTPRQTPHGWWRHGPIYVLPEYRQRGLVVDYYAAHPERLCVAFIPHGNEASLRTHERAGFVPWKQHRYGTFYRREPQCTGS